MASNSRQTCNFKHKVLIEGMDSFKHPSTNVHNHLSLSHNFHRIIKFLVSVSLFSVSFILLPFLLQSFKAYFMQLFNYSFGKSYIFLLCNGLLFCLAKNSGLINGSSPSTDQTEEFTVDNPETDHSAFKELEGTAPIGGENDDEIEERQEEKNLVIGGQEDGFSDRQEETDHSEFMESEHTAPINGENDVEIESRQEEEKSLVLVVQNEISVTKEEAAGEEEGNAIMIIEEDEHDEEDTEELNKKCEDFIRKMKAAFCSEPRHDYCSDFDFQTALVAIK